MIDYQPLIQRWQDTELTPWAELLPAQIARGLAVERYGVTFLDTADAYGPELDEYLIADTLHPYPAG
ncbi:MAG: hypothetical protein ACNA7T_03160, partial [Haliea sp.]